MRFLLFCAALASATRANACFSPVVPAFNACAECTSAELTGTQCVRQGRWLTCYSSVDACCKDGELANHVTYTTCVANSRASNSSGLSDSSDSTSDDSTATPISSADCKRVVAKNSSTTNKACQEQCQRLANAGASTDATYTSQCMVAHYEIRNGRTQPTNDCFTKWVYGYSEPDRLSSIAKAGLVTDTPAECQALCQEDDECVNFVWTSELLASQQASKKGCLLKSRKMLEKALSVITTTDTAVNMDVNYCNYQMGYACNHLYNCLPCDGDKRCVWESDVHIAGFKYCGMEETCKPDYSFPPPVTAPAVTPQPEIPTTLKPEKTAPPATLEPEIPTTLKPEKTAPPATPEPEIPTTLKPEKPAHTATPKEPAHPATPKPETPVTQKPEEPVPPATPQPEFSATSTPKQPARPATPATPSIPKPATPAPSATSPPATVSAPKPEGPILPATPEPEQPAPPATPKPENPVTPKPEGPAPPATPLPETLATPKPTQPARPATPTPETPNTTKAEEEGSPATPKPQQPARPTTPRPETPAPTRIPEGEIPSLVSPSVTGIVLETTPESLTNGGEPQEPPAECGERAEPECLRRSKCNCCGHRSCGCCQKGILLKITDKPKHLQFEIDN